MRRRFTLVWLLRKLNVGLGGEHGAELLYRPNKEVMGRVFDKPTVLSFAGDVVYLVRLDIRISDDQGKVVKGVALKQGDKPGVSTGEVLEGVAE